MKKILSFLLVLCLCLPLCLFTACETEPPKQSETPVYNTTGKPQKAMLILPGMLSSNLIDAESGETLWSIGSLLFQVAMNKDMLDENGKFRLDAFAGYLDSFLDRNEDGTAERTTRPANQFDADLAYGISDNYYPLYSFLNERFGADTSYGYQIMVWQYDWSKSVAESGAALETFLTANQYEDVILLGHSMGGLVIDEYLAKSEENRANTKAVFTFGTPHLGAVDGAAFLLGGGMFSLNALFGTLSDAIVPQEFVEMLPADCADLNEFIARLTGVFLAEARKMPGAYDLLPNERMFQTGVPVLVNGTECTYAQFRNQLAALSDNAYLTNYLNGYTDDRTIDGKHVTDLVQTYYFVGTDIPTASTAMLRQTPGANGFTVTVRPIPYGDSLVLNNSATAGHDWTEENVFLFSGIDHTKLTEVTNETGAPNEIGETLIELLQKIV